jgi:hypothetical protein
MFTNDRVLALARLEARIGFVDDIDPAFAADQLVVAMALHQAFERIANFHTSPVNVVRLIVSQFCPVNHRTDGPARECPKNSQIPNFFGL